MIGKSRNSKTVNLIPEFETLAGEFPNLQEAPPAPSLFHNHLTTFVFYLFMYRSTPDSDSAMCFYQFNLPLPVFITVRRGSFPEIDSSKLAPKCVSRCTDAITLQ